MAARVADFRHFMIDSCCRAFSAKPKLAGQQYLESCIEEIGKVRFEAEEFSHESRDSTTRVMAYLENLTLDTEEKLDLERATDV